jgi:hypothetical protein
VGQLRRQTPLSHASPELQARPHIPQFARSLVRSRHEPEQLVWPTAQLSWHVRLVQTWPGPQAVPQVPQLPLSVLRSTQRPLQFT